MPLLNYTTEISVEKTINEIHKALISNGARTILNEYDEKGGIVALSFQCQVGDRLIAFRLPSDWQPVLKILQHDSKIPRRFSSPEQAQRVSWRIIKDWVEAQMAIVQTKMVTIDQVFLPYAVTEDGKTIYEKIRERGFSLKQIANG